MASKSQIITPFDADMIMHLIELRSVKAAVNRANASGDPDTLPAHARYFYNMAADLVAQQLTIKSPNPCPTTGGQLYSPVPKRTICPFWGSPHLAR